MISNDGTGRYWATAIIVKWHEHAGSSGGEPFSGWSGSVDFLDDGFCDDNADAARVSTEGTLRTRYAVQDGQTVPGLRVVIDTLIADAARLEIRFGVGDQQPTIFYKGDGEDSGWSPPPRWQQMLSDECARLGWESSYADWIVGDVIRQAIDAGAAVTEPKES
jgi:hypothetical protein